MTDNEEIIFIDEETLTAEEWDCLLYTSAFPHKISAFPDRRKKAMTW